MCFYSEEYPSLAEGIGLENRQAGQTARGFESLFLLHKFNNSFLQCGGVAKWLNAADCKSAPSGFGGSNPSPSTNLFLR